jgi:hypothetical protein
MSGVKCESNLCYYSSNCSAIKLQSGFGFTAFSGNNSTPVELSSGSHLLSGELADKDSNSCYLPFTGYNGDTVMIGNQIAKEYLTVFDLESKQVGLGKYTNYMFSYVDESATSNVHWADITLVGITAALFVGTWFVSRGKKPIK